MLPKDNHLSDFVKSILIFAILTVVVIGAFGFYLFSNSRSLVVQEISRDSLYRLEHVRDYLETTTLRSYEEVFQDRVVSTVFDKHDGLGFFLNDASGHLGYRYLELHQDIQNAKLSHAGLTNMAVYFTGSGFAIDSRYVYEKIINARDAAFLGNILEFPLNRWTSRLNGDGERVLTYVRSLPYGATEQEAKGYLYLDVSLNYVTGLIGTMLSTADERIYLVDPDGTTLLTNADTAVQFGDSEEMSRKTASVNVVKEAGQTTVWAYSPANLSKYDWGYVVQRPLDSFLLDSKKSQHNLIVASIAAVLVGLAISLLMSRRVYVPLKNMIRSIQSLNSSLEKTRLLKLIHGDTGDLTGIGSGTGTGAANPYPEGSRFSVAYIRLHSGALQPQMLGRWLNAKPFRWEAVEISREELAVLFVLEPIPASELVHPDGTESTPTAEETVKSALLSLQDELQDNCAFGAGFGGVTQRLDGLAESFREAKQAAKYEFLYGPAAVIGYSEIAGRNEAMADLNFERFEDAIHANEPRTVSSYLEGMGRMLKQSDYRVETAEWALMQLNVSLRRMALHYNLSDRMEIPDMTQVLKRGTLGEGLEGIEAGAKQIVAFLSDDSPHMHAETVSLIQRYIQEHMEEDISLDRVAELVSFSPSYISKLFVEVLHTPFIEYLSRVRLDRAAELLRDGDESVTRIAALVGFSNVQYFCTKFKSKHDMTPNQYRKVTRAKLQAEAI